MLNFSLGALAYAITSGHTSLPPWRLLFLVEGIPTVLFAVIIFLYLPDSPDTAKFLSEDERRVAKARSVLQSGKEGKERLGSIDKGEIVEAFESLQTVIPAVMYFSCNVSFSSLPVFLPSILGAMGFSSLQAQGLTAPPYLLAFCACVGTTYLADRLGQRGIVVAALSALAGTGYVLLATVRSVAVRYLGVFLAAAGVFPAIANILPWTLNNQGSDTRRGAGIAILNLVGQCGPILGTRLFPVAEEPYYTKGMITCAAFMFFNAVLAGVLRFHLARKNRLLEEAEWRITEDATNVEVASVRGNKASEMEGTVGYRYVL